MTQAPKHAQFTMNTALKDHLINNGDTLSELLFAYADINAMAALSLLRDGGKLAGSRTSASSQQCDG
jgi:hypothetical protein